MSNVWAVIFLLFYLFFNLLLHLMTDHFFITVVAIIANVTDPTLHGGKKPMRKKYTPEKVREDRIKEYFY